ncbi:MAG: hypothetical protein Solivirus1_56 [Solivirus sp.]|uniref:BZIP domain-containing protein n=1 Tax=Solivirus sp. TaxID=2487772 RepID=A0A3G5AJR5_9VIRU|nr:MAG: hypothetical protein Solivirus1_56 [Solivirus sp.]
MLKNASFNALPALNSSSSSVTSVGISSSSNSTTPPSPNVFAQALAPQIEKCVNQYEHKKAYNKEYYQKRTKLKREEEKKNLEEIQIKIQTLEKENTELKSNLNSLIQERQKFAEFYNSSLKEKSDTASQIEQQLTYIQELTQRLNSLYQDNVSLANELSRVSTSPMNSSSI